MLCRATWGYSREQNEQGGAVGSRLCNNNKVGCFLIPARDMISFLEYFCGLAGN